MTNIIGILKIGSIALCALAVAVPVGARAAEIQLRSHVVSRGSLVLLGDVAEVQGADEKEVEGLKRVELFPAPSRGTTRVLRQREVQELLRLNEVEVERHQVSGPRLTTITSAAVASRTERPAQPEQQPIDQQWYVVPIRDLSAGVIVRRQDVALRAQPAGQAIGSAARRFEEVVDMQLIRPAAAGQPLLSQILQRPLLVRQNEIITVESRAAGVLVRTTARARESGSLGDVIVLQSLPSRERYSARVIGPKRAEVFASGVTVSSPPVTPERGPQVQSAGRTLP